LREVKGGTKAQADELLANHEVTFSQEGKTVSVTARNKKNRTISWDRQPWLEVRYEVSIPKQFDVDLKTAGGNIRVDEMDGNAVAHTSSGSIDLPAVTGRVEARNAGGNISIGEAGANVNAQTTSGSILMKKAKGKVELSNAGGNIRVDEAGGDVAAQTTSGSVNVGSVNGRSVRIRNAGGNIAIGEAVGDVWVETTSGSISVKKANGKVDARDAGGDISIGEAGDIWAETTSGSISVKKANGKVDARNAGGNISIGEAGGEAAVRTTSGAIVVELAVGKLTAHNAGGRIKVADARDVVTAETSSGSIEVSFSSPPRGECRLEVSGGGINAALPKSAAVNLDAKASGGRVVSDLPVTVTGQGGRKSGALEGKINGGGPALVLRASAGDIHVKESASSPMAAEDDAPAR
jgi:DUF4097 and DUF4098 domain-containing protein YvlB